MKPDAPDPQPIPPLGLSSDDIRGLSRLSSPRTAEAFAHTVVLVEGVSDQRAVESLARRRGRNLDAEGISIVPMGGATNIRRFLEVFGPQGFDVRLAGLCDAREEGHFRRALNRYKSTAEGRSSSLAVHHARGETMVDRDVNGASRVIAVRC